MADATADTTAETKTDTATADQMTKSTETVDTTAAVDTTTKGGTILDGELPDDKPAAADWPDDWREKMAGGDDKTLKMLSRYTSPKTLAGALMALRAKVSGGELKKVLGDNPTETELVEYRKEHGIPEKPDGYMEKLPDGLVIGDADKPILSKVFEAAHQLNAPKSVMDGITTAYYAAIEEEQAQAIEAQRAAKAETEDALRAEWGQEYRANINTLKGFVGALPDELGEKLGTATLADGTALFNDAATVRWLVGLAREANPLGTVLPGAGQDRMKSVSDEIASLEAMMGDKKSAYWKGSTAEANQARYRQLLEWREKNKG